MANCALEACTAKHRIISAELCIDEALLWIGDQSDARFSSGRTENYARRLSSYILPREDGSLREWVIIELQGDLTHSTGDTKNAKFIGDLHFAKNGAPVLVIGIHILYGKEMKLAKPFAVLEKIHRNERSDAIEDEIEDVTETEYIVRAVVKKKLIFKGRPKPIVTDIPICV